MKALTSNENALAIFEGHLWIKLIHKDFSCNWTQMQHYGLIVEASNKELVLVSLIVKTFGELDLRVYLFLFFGGGEHF